MQAIEAAGTTVLEPVNHFELDIPPDSVARVLSLLAESGPWSSRPRSTHARPLEGAIPAATTHPFETHLPGQTHGEGILTPTETTYQPVPGTPPTRTRTDGNPLNQKQYLLHLNQA